MSGPATPDDFSYLPPTLADIAREAGLPAALALMREKGGQKIVIPKRAPDGHWIVALVGREAADALGAYYGGAPVAIPIGKKSSWRAFLTQRRAAVEQMVADGRNLNAIADGAGMHVRSISRWKARIRRDGGQGSLF